MERYDLIVIGSGRAGEKGAAQAAYFGRRVAMIERAPQLGGAGVNTGTIPSKTLRETALYFSGLRQRGLYGAGHAPRSDLSMRDFMFREGLMVMQVGGTIDAFVEAAFNYPTLTDAYKYAAYDGLGALQRRQMPP